MTFDGAYHVRGDVQFVNGTVRLLSTTVFYVDGSSGQQRNPPYNNRTTIDVQNATLRLSGATLQANCPDAWGGVTLTGTGKIYTEAVVSGKRTYRPVIRDANIGVHSFTPDWTIANTNEYYLSQTDFRNNDTGLYDLVKGTAQPGEGARNCTFQDGRVGIQFESVDYYPTKVYGGNYDDAAFEGNTFRNLQYGMLGQAGAIHVSNSTFVNNYFVAFSVESTITNVGEIIYNTVVVPAVWPTTLVNSLPANYPQQSTGIASYGIGSPDIAGNTIVGATATPAANAVQQTGMSVGGNCRVYDGNVFRNLDCGLAVGTSDYGTGSTHSVTGNTFENNVNGLTFSGYAYYNQGTPRVTLRCNTFRTTQPGGVGVWVTAGTPFPAVLGNANAPNGNRFDGIADDKKRFVYDASNSFQYFRYNSTQEELGTSNNITGNTIYTYGGGTSSATVPTPYISGLGACGNSSTPGVYARQAPANQASDSPNSSPIHLDETYQFSEAYPNPASETVSFTYSLPTTNSSVELVLRDLLGREMARQPLAGRTGEAHMSVQHLPAGFCTSAIEVAGRRQVSHKLTVSH